MESNVIEMANLLVVEEYEWNPDSLLMKSHYIDGKLFSHVYEKEREMIVLQKPKDVIDYSCQYYGMSLEGNQKGASIVTNYKKKLPVIICKELNLVVFPTASPSRDNCYWIDYSSIKDFNKSTSNETSILFNNQVEMVIPMSFASFNTQYGRAAVLQSRLKSRVAETKRKYGLIDDDEQ